MNFALDYDGTYTSDPALWLSWATQAIKHGHGVYLVTMRYPNELFGGPDAVHLGLVDLLVMKQPKVNPRMLGQQVIIPTSRKAKGPVVKALGVEIHVWIDDNPNAVHLDAVQIWGQSSPEGQVVDPHYD